MMHKRWTKEENEILRNYYTTEGPNVVDKLPGRTRTAVRLRAQQLGIYNRQANISWTESEIAILKTYYPKEGKRVMTKLPGRSLKNIQVTAHRLGIHRVRIIK